ncbi:MAG: molybdopterin biosynthesis protein [Planctomyces sp.]|nr:molybdopterin biosynthesis protein [Planctomyces sp.]
MSTPQSSGNTPATGRGQQRYFLSDIPLDEARQRFHDAMEQAGCLSAMPEEIVALDQAQGRITANPIWASASSPHYDAAAMDGIAVRAEETNGATETSPINLTVNSQAVWLGTGDPMPSGYNAVVMVEHVHRIDEGTVQIMAPVAPWQHVRTLGEDLVATELVLPENHQLSPIDLGACAAAGVTGIPVRRRPKVAIIPTGNELVSLGATPLKPGDIVEFNSLMLAGLIRDWGGDAQRFPPVPDDFPTIRDTVLEALKGHDLVLVNAGSSAGSEDYTAAVVEELGQLLVHGVAVRPGHPVVLGLVQDKPVIGLPGYPVSAVLTAELFVKPLLERWLGQAPQAPPTIDASITRKVLSPLGEDEYLRVKLGRVGEKMVATPLQRGAGIIMSLVRADGMVVIPRFSEGIDAGSNVQVQLLQPLEKVENTILAIGSHDLTLDLLASHLGKTNPGLRLASSHIGSLGGLIALQRGEAHLAGSHLLDEDTGEYNLSYIRQHLPGVPVVLINLVGRVQGLMVPPGNPKAIHHLEDLARPGIAFVNRQRGSGTRVLLDYKLKGLNIGPDQVSGYQREEYSHLAVAAAVKAGSADTGLGILSAARALDLDFVPLMDERYELVIPRVHYDSGLLQPLLALLHDTAFQQEVESMGGYHTEDMGKIVAEID